VTVVVVYQRSICGLLSNNHLKELPSLLFGLNPDRFSWNHIDQIALFTIF
jgi:hypothetical protein